MSHHSDNNYHRRSIRLPNWDYRKAGAYFVTICTYQREPHFDDPQKREAAADAWQAIPSHSSRVTLDDWVLMPDHLHGILVLSDSKEAPQPADKFDMRWAVSPTEASLPRMFANAPSGSLGAIVRSYKSVVTRQINRLRRTPSGKVWQRGYYEHIIRDVRELERIRAYIQNNPARWAAEHDDLNVLLTRMRLQG